MAEHVNASVLKIKLAMAIIGISSIHLLRTFIEAGALGSGKTGYTETGVMWQTIIHGLSSFPPSASHSWTGWGSKPTTSQSITRIAQRSPALLGRPTISIMMMMMKKPATWVLVLLLLAPLNARAADPAFGNFCNRSGPTPRSLASRVRHSMRRRAGSNPI